MNIIAERRACLHRYQKVVSIENNGLRLGAFLKIAFSMLPDFAVEKALRARDVKVNGVRMGRDALLGGGDVVDVYTPAERREPIVIYEDENLFIVHKPGGLSSDSARPDEESVQSWAAERCPGAEICHRLDNQTSGLLLIAKTRAAYDEIWTMFEQRVIQKTYECLVFGSPQPPSAVLTAWLTKDASAGRVTVTAAQKPGALRIVTEYSTLEAASVSRLRILLHTGRTHQIRAHLSYMGYPIVGDDVYGDRAANRQRNARKLCLCATELHLSSSGALSYLNGRIFRITAPF